MKRIFFISSFIFSAIISQAQTVTGNRVIAKQALYLKDAWIDSVKKDTAGMAGSTNTLPTSDVVSKLFKNVILNQYASAQTAKIWLGDSARFDGVVTFGKAIKFPSFTSDPTGSNGTGYYNSVSNHYRYYQNGAWGNIPLSDASGNYVFYDGSISVPGTGTNSQRFGFNATAIGDFSLAIGYTAQATVAQATAIGYGALASGSTSFAAGYSSEASGGNDAVAVGSGAKAYTSYATAVGSGSQAKGSLRATSIGAYATADGFQATAVGGYSYVPTANATAIGGGAYATTQGAVAIGSSASATHTNSMAIGWEAATSENDQIMVGNTKRPINLSIHGSYQMWLKEPNIIGFSSYIDSTGSLAYAAYNVRVSAIDFSGRETAANQVMSADNPSGKNAYNIVWNKVGGAVSYKVFVGTYGAVDRYFTTTDTTYKFIAYGTGDGATLGTPVTIPTAIGVEIRNMYGRFPFLAGTGTGKVVADPNGFLQRSSYADANLLKATATLDFPTTAANSSSILTVTVTDAAPGDQVLVTKAAGGTWSNGEVYTAYVSATNTVSIRLQNVSGGSYDLSSDTYNITVIKF